MLSLILFALVMLVLMVVAGFVGKWYLSLPMGEAQAQARRDRKL